jgi:hypothetical protein
MQSGNCADDSRGQGLMDFFPLLLIIARLIVQIHGRIHVVLDEDCVVDGTGLWSD